MAQFSSVTQQHLLQAIAEYDARGADDFLALYGFPPSTDQPLRHEGREYDARALLGVAHRFATGRLATPEEFHGGAKATATLLRRRGFEVAGPVVEEAPARAARTTRTSTPRTSTPRTTTPRTPARRKAPVVVCPTCFTALPATGVCDNCS